MSPELKRILNKYMSDYVSEGYTDPISSIIYTILFVIVAVIVLIFVVILLIAGGISWFGTTVSKAVTPPAKETFQPRDETDESWLRL